MNNLNLKSIVVPISAAILIYGVAENYGSQLERLKCPTLTEVYQQDSSSVTRASMVGVETINKIRTIHSFAVKMIENMVELEPSIIEMVDRKFWDLI